MENSITIDKISNQTSDKISAEKGAGRQRINTFPLSGKSMIGSVTPRFKKSRIPKYVSNIVASDGEICQCPEYNGEIIQQSYGIGYSLECLLEELNNSKNFAKKEDIRKTLKTFNGFKKDYFGLLNEKGKSYFYSNLAVVCALSANFGSAEENLKKAGRTYSLNDRLETVKEFIEEKKLHYSQISNK